MRRWGCKIFTLIKAFHVISNQSRPESNSMNNTCSNEQSMTKRFPQVTEQADRKSSESQSFSWVPQMSHFSSNLQELNDEC